MLKQTVPKLGQAIVFGPGRGVFGAAGPMLPRTERTADAGFDFLLDPCSDSGMGICPVGDLAGIAELNAIAGRVQPGAAELGQDAFLPFLDCFLGVGFGA